MLSGCPHFPAETHRQTLPELINMEKHRNFLSDVYFEGSTALTLNSADGPNPEAVTLAM
jgi:hypothetical protein